MFLFCLTLGAVALYTAAYTVHAVRRRAWGCALGSALLFVLPVLCIIGLSITP